MTNIDRISIACLISLVAVFLFYALFSTGVKYLSEIESIDKNTQSSHTNAEYRALSRSPVSDEDRDFIFRIAINYTIEKHGTNLLFCKPDQLSATRVDQRTFRRRLNHGHSGNPANLPKSLNNINDYYQVQMLDDGDLSLMGYFADCSESGFNQSDTTRPIDLSSFESYAESQVYRSPNNEPFCYVRFGTLSVSALNNEAVMPLSYACGRLYGYPGEMTFIRTIDGWASAGIIETGVY